MPWLQIQLHQSHLRLSRRLSVAYSQPSLRRSDTSSHQSLPWHQPSQRSNQCLWHCAHFQQFVQLLQPWRHLAIDRGKFACLHHLSWSNHQFLSSPSLLRSPSSVLWRQLRLRRWRPLLSHQLPVAYRLPSPHPLNTSLHQLLLLRRPSHRLGQYL